ncbi:thiolase family protein [Lysinibacillus sp. KU-BSD001]|uniref:thiolase family protein n=1 Tax=Lysinibacillus sp. KU-BSD001 TaxID=3141328 RepID=UPI0036E8AEED
MFEAVIVDAIRTPMGKRGGRLANEHPVDLLGSVLKALVERNELDPAIVDDVIIGCVDQVDEQSSNIARNAWLAAGLPITVPGVTIDRQCGSSLQAVHFAAQGVMSGSYDVVIAGGIESMTRVPIGTSARDGKTPMTESLFQRFDLQGYGFNQFGGAEMIAHEIGLTREQIDAYSVRSHERAYEAQQNGYFDKEIIPVQVKDAEGNVSVFHLDETIRPDASIEKMTSLQPVYPGLQTVTPGTSSQISDGASAVLIMSKEAAKKYGLQPRAVFKAFSVVGSDPVAMLKGPAIATEKVLQKAGLSKEEIDLVEINEAFASVVLRWEHEIGIPLEKVNVNGGAIALGHALGSTGTRLVTTLLHELERRQLRYGLVTICEGPGMANGLIIERMEGGNKA